MRTSLFISSRLSLRSKAALVSIAVSFAVMVIALAVMAGFRTQIRHSLSDLCGDLRVVPVNSSFSPYSQAISLNAEHMEELRSLEGIDRIHPVVYRAGVINAGDDIHGVLFRGVDNVADSSYFDADLGALCAVSVPRTLAQLLDLKPGDKVKAYFIGEQLVSRRLTVCNVYENIITADNQLVVNCDRQMLCRVNGMQPDQSGALEIVLSGDAYSRMEQVRSAVEDVIEKAQPYNDCGLLCESLAQSFPQIYDWLNVIDSNVKLILVLMVIAAGFNMIVALLIFLFENMQTIGTLKALGMNTGAIVRSFLFSSGRALAFGQIAGNLIALLLCLIQYRFHVVKLNPVNYFVSYVPVRVDWMFLLEFNLAAFAIIILMVMIPCRFISRIDPSKTLLSE